MSATFKPEFEKSSVIGSTTQQTVANRTFSNEDTDLDADDWDFNDQKKLSPKQQKKQKSPKRIKKKSRNYLEN